MALGTLQILLFEIRTKKSICGALRDLVPFAQFKKREKHPWRSVAFTPPWVFSTF